MLIISIYQEIKDTTVSVEKHVVNQKLKHFEDIRLRELFL
jgi:hypothetical protein